MRALGRSLLGGLVSGLVAISGCDKPEDTTAPGEGAGRPLPGATAPVDEAPAADPQANAPTTSTEPGPVVAHPEDRDQEEEKRKMSLSRERSAKALEQLREDNLDRAIREARQALKIHEQNVEAMLVIAEAFFKQGKYEIAQSVASSVLEVDPRVLTTEESSMAYNLRGFAFLAEGKDEPAMNMFRKAAEGDPNNAAAWNNLGVAYMKQGDYGTALSCFDYAVQLSPEFIKARLNLGAAQRAQGKLVEAEATFRKVLDARPRYAEVHFNLGVLYLDAESFPNLDTTARLNKAIQSFQKYKSLALGTTAQTPGEPSKSKPGPSRKPTNAPPESMATGEFVSPAQADLYIGVAKKGLEREERKKEREQKREAKKSSTDDVPEEPAPADDDSAVEPGEAEDDDQDGGGGDAPPPQGPGAQKPGAQKPGAQKPGTPSPQAPEESPTEPVQPQKPQPQKPGGGLP